jgi:hypothetical protein
MAVGRLDGGELAPDLELLGQGFAEIGVVVDDEDGLGLRHGAKHAPLAWALAKEMPAELRQMHDFHGI